MSSESSFVEKLADEIEKNMRNRRCKKCDAVTPHTIVSRFSYCTPCGPDAMKEAWAKSRKSINRISWTIFATVPILLATAVWCSREGTVRLSSALLVLGALFARSWSANTRKIVRGEDSEMLDAEMRMIRANRRDAKEQQ